MKPPKNICLFLPTCYYLYHYPQSIPGLVCSKVADLWSWFSFHHSSQRRTTTMWAQARARAQYKPEEPRRAKSKSPTPHPCEPKKCLLILETDIGLVTKFKSIDNKDLIYWKFLSSFCYYFMVFICLKILAFKKIRHFQLNNNIFCIAVYIYNNKFA